MRLGFGAFFSPFQTTLQKIMVPSFNKKNIFTMMHSSSLNIFSTRHVIYQVSEKVYLEKTTQL